MAIAILTPDQLHVNENGGACCHVRDNREWPDTSPCAIVLTNVGQTSSLSSDKLRLEACAKPGGKSHAAT